MYVQILKLNQIIPVFLCKLVLLILINYIQLSYTIEHGAAHELSSFCFGFEETTGGGCGAVWWSCVQIRELW